MINAPSQICEMQQGNQLNIMKLDLLHVVRLIRFSKGFHLKFSAEWTILLKEAASPLRNFYRDPLGPIFAVS